MTEPASDPDEALRRILNGREVIPGPDLSRCFEIKRGVGVGPNKLISWRSRKNHIPFVQEGHKIFYPWPEAWDWYLVEFAGKRNKAA